MKINEQDIATWRAGELLTEHKLQTVFTLIAKAINLTDDELNRIEIAINSLRLALRWLGSFDTYQQYQEWELQHTGDPQFQPPNNPLPSAGDVILINDSSTMPEGSFPPGLQHGRYLFIFVQEYDIQTGQVIKHGWELYNPLALPNATRVNDGLMSKEMFIKLDEMKSQEETDIIIGNLEDRVSTTEDTLKEIKPIVEQNKKDLTTLKPEVEKLKSQKQDVATNIPNYRTKTVTDNLQEVKLKVDNLAGEISGFDIIIWQPETPTNKLATQDGSLFTTKFDFEAEDTKFLGESYVRAYITAYNINDPGNEHVVSITMKNLKQSDAKFTSIGTETMFMHGATHDEVCEVNTWISKRGAGQYTLNVEVRPEKIIPNTNYSVQFDKLIKDIGVSDYMMAEQITEDLQEFLKGSIGLKRKLVTSKPNGDTIFQPGDIIDLGFDYLPNSNAVLIFQGGTKLTQNIIWEEVPGADEFKANRIKFLKEVDMNKDGELEITAASVILNSYQVKYWNNTDTFVKGEVVYYNGRMYFCKVTNVNKKPDEERAYWELLQFEIDLENLEARIKAYVYEVSLDQAKKALEQYEKGNAVYFLKNEISEYATRADLRDTVTWLQTNKAFILDGSGNKTYVTFDNINSLFEEIYHKEPEEVSYVIKWLDTIYATQVADVKVLQATPQEVSTEVKAQLAQYEQGIPTEYADTVQVFPSQEVYEAFRDAHGLTDDDFIDVTPPSTDLSQLATKKELEQLKDNIDTKLSSKADKDHLENNYLNLKTTQVQQITGQVNFQSGIRLNSGLTFLSSNQETSSIQALYDTTNNRFGLTISGAIDFTSTDVKVGNSLVATQSWVNEQLNNISLMSFDVELNGTISPGPEKFFTGISAAHIPPHLLDAIEHNKYMFQVLKGASLPHPLVSYALVIDNNEINITARCYSTSSINVNNVMRILFWK